MKLTIEMKYSNNEPDDVRFVISLLSFVLWMVYDGGHCDNNCIYNHRNQATLMLASATAAKRTHEELLQRAA